MFVEGLSRAWETAIATAMKVEEGTIITAITIEAEKGPLLVVARVY